MNNNEIKEIYNRYTDDNVADAIIEVAHTTFNEDNFNFYDFSTSIFSIIKKQVADNILSAERALRIHKLMGDKINKMIYSIINSNCDKCCKSND